MQTVRLIYNLYLGGLSLNAVARELTERGLPTPGGSAVWHPTDKYRKVIYRCDHKYDGDRKCSMLHSIRAWHGSEYVVPIGCLKD